MKTYIGTKIVKAEPMSQGDFVMVTGKEGVPITVDPNGNTPPGYKVVYEDGYMSWSPKEVFERCYREITEKEKGLIL